MTRTQNQKMADAHEQDIAEWIGGRQTKGSGNQWQAQMDAKNGINKVPFPIAGDGKATLGKSVGVSREMWRKAEEQSFGEIPALFLRFYRDSTLRTVDQDLVVLSADDFKRMLEAARAHICQQEGHQEILGEGLVPDVADHDYTSTYCQHELKDPDSAHLHDKCRDTCKICHTLCQCPNHPWNAE